MNTACAPPPHHQPPHQQPPRHQSQHGAQAASATSSASGFTSLPAATERRWRARKGTPTVSPFTACATARVGSPGWLPTATTTTSIRVASSRAQASQKWPACLFVSASLRPACLLPTQRGAVAMLVGAMVDFVTGGSTGISPEAHPPTQPIRQTSTLTSPARGSCLDGTCATGRGRETQQTEPQTTGARECMHRREPRQQRTREPA
jgi:hypothetical protein